MAFRKAVKALTLASLATLVTCQDNSLFARATSTGDTQCVPLMCVSAVVTGSTVEYTLTSSGTQKMAWMAMGFGSTMANSPMVIMWPNSDSSITLSQRMAPAEVMPTVVPNPPRTATLDSSASLLTGSQPKLVYTIPTESGGDGTTTAQNVIWAFGIVPPNNPSPDANLQQHLDSGTFVLDLSKPIASNSSSGTPAPSSSTSGGGGDGLKPYQKMVVAHGILSAIGFLGLLPLGVFVARYGRTFGSGWFVGHAITQSVISGPVIIAGVALGIHAVTEGGQMHLDDTHKKWGVAIFAIYFAQLALGILIHWLKPKSTSSKNGHIRNHHRPLQNYFHAILGLLLIAFAFYQVREGYRTEWVKETGRPAVSRGVNIVWIVWVVLLPVLYLAGLLLLRKQFKQEKEGRAGMGTGTNGEQKGGLVHSESPGSD